MKKMVLGGLLFAATAGVARADDQELYRFRLAAGAGPNLGLSGDALHFAVAPSFALNRHFALGADLGYSYLPLAPNARGGGNRAYWGLATLTAEALPRKMLSPYLVLGYGLGRYADTRGDSELGRAAALGAGLNLRLNPRTHLFVESRFAMMDNIVARDGLHMELPVKVGLRVAF
jgi:hypothetical protein